jgi:hypothetical protein
MLRHVACFAWNESMTPDDLVTFEGMLAALPGQVPEIRVYRYGRDLDLVDTTFDFAINADFDSEADWRTYQAHPAHVEILEFVMPRARQRVGVQFEIDDA